MLVRGGRGGRDHGERLLQVECSLEGYFLWVFLVLVPVVNMLCAWWEKVGDFDVGIVKPRIYDRACSLMEAQHIAQAQQAHAPGVHIYYMGLQDSFKLFTNT